MCPIRPIRRWSQRFPNVAATPPVQAPLEDDDEYEYEKVALQNIENREQEHPHDINKVPIKAGTLEEPMLLGRDVPGERSDQTNDQEDHADGDVTAVKSCEHEEAGAHDPRRVEPESFVKEVLPFIGLVTKEQRTQQDGQYQ